MRSSSGPLRILEMAATSRSSAARLIPARSSTRPLTFTASRSGRSIHGSLFGGSGITSATSKPPPPEPRALTCTPVSWGWCALPVHLVRARHARRSRLAHGCLPARRQHAYLDLGSQSRGFAFERPSGVPEGADALERAGKVARSPVDRNRDPRLDQPHGLRCARRVQVAVAK